MDAADGFILLARGETNQVLPPDFLTFVRPDDPQPDIPAEVRFGPGLRLLGYDVVDDERWRLTRFRYYWQVVRLRVYGGRGDPDGGAVGGRRVCRQQRPAARSRAGLAPTGPVGGRRRDRLRHQGLVPSTPVRACCAPRAAAARWRRRLWRWLHSPRQLHRSERACPAPRLRPTALRPPSMVRREGRLSLSEGALSPVVAADVVFAADAWQVRLAEWECASAAALGGCAHRAAILAGERQCAVRLQRVRPPAGRDRQDRLTGRCSTNVVRPAARDDLAARGRRHNGRDRRACGRGACRPCTGPI